MRELANRIAVLGGHCEGVAGGVLIVHVPRKLDLDIQQELKRPSRPILIEQEFTVKAHLAHD